VVGETRGWMMADDTAQDLVAVEKSGLTPAQYGQLAEVPPELEWLANLTNPKTRRAYKIDVEEFIAFAGLRRACCIFGSRASAARSGSFPCMRWLNG
jgi:hypothetical protein